MIGRRGRPGPEQAPLTALECERIWRWERSMIAFYASAMLAISAAVLLLWWMGTEQWVRIAIVVGVGVLTLVGAWVQFRERCPRCRTLLGRQSRFMLPMRCRVCKVEFPRQPKRGPHTEVD